jgi:hypothetical protein
MLDRFVGEELWHQIQLAVTEPQPVEHQCYRRRPDTHLLAVPRLLLI